MKDKHLALLDEKNLNEQPKKASYSSPVLKIYGAVSKLTMGSGSIQGDSGPQSMMTGSDRDIKENIVRIGEHPLGIGLYLFDYLPAYQGMWGRGRKFGVLANEVEPVMPEAVSIHPDGYQMVNYSMLGISYPTH